MTEWETILFIGGPADGRKLGIPLYTQTYQVAKPRPPFPSAGDRFTPEEVLGIAPFKYILYHRMKILGRGKEHALMVRGGMTADEVLERLMLYYRPPEQREEP